MWINSKRNFGSSRWSFEIDWNLFPWTFHVVSNNTHQKYQDRLLGALNFFCIHRSYLLTKMMSVMWSSHWSSHCLDDLIHLLLCCGKKKQNNHSSLQHCFSSSCKTTPKSLLSQTCHWALKPNISTLFSSVYWRLFQKCWGFFRCSVVNLSGASVFFVF